MRRRAASLTITTITPGMRAVPGPVASVVVVETVVVAIRPALAVRTSSYTAVAVAARLILLAAAGTPTTILGWPGTFLLLLLVEGPPLLGSVQQLAADSGGVGFRRLLSVLDRLELPGDILDGELLKISIELTICAYLFGMLWRNFSTARSSVRSVSPLRAISPIRLVSRTVKS
jgi:hypothetical protein